MKEDNDRDEIMEVMTGIWDEESGIYFVIVKRFL